MNNPHFVLHNYSTIPIFFIMKSVQIIIVYISVFSSQLKIVITTIIWLSSEIHTTSH